MRMYKWETTEGGSCTSRRRPVSDYRLLTYVSPLHDWVRFQLHQHEQFDSLIETHQDINRSYETRSFVSEMLRKYLLLKSWTEFMQKIWSWKLACALRLFSRGPKKYYDLWTTVLCNITCMKLWGNRFIELKMVSGWQIKPWVVSTGEAPAYSSIPADFARVVEPIGPVTAVVSPMLPQRSRLRTPSND